MQVIVWNRPQGGPRVEGGRRSLRTDSKRPCYNVRRRPQDSRLADLS